MRRLTSAVLALSIALSSAPHVVASDADAKDLFARGRELRAKGDCAGAVPLFRKAWELFPTGLGSLRNLAECEEQLGHWASSRRAWLDLKRGVIVAKDASKYEGWEADANAAAARLAPKVARLTIEVKQKTASGEGPLGELVLKVSVNGEPIDAKLLGVPLDRDPGSYVVKIEGGKEPVEKSVTVAAGESKSVKLVVEAPDTASTAGPAPIAGPAPTGSAGAGTPETPPSSGSSGMKTAGVVALGVGAVGLIGMGVSIVIRSGAKSDLSAACPAYESGTCATSDRAAAQAAIDSGQTASTMATVFGIVAVIGIGAGVGLLVVGSKKGTESKTSVRLAPWAATTGGGAMLGGTF